jgi:hypothetical protein
MKQITTLLIVLFFSISISKAQHLWYPDNKNGDIIMNEIKVTNTTPYSYWETMGWNVGAEGGAYCGIQQSAQGTNFIFSIWDPKASKDPITAPYKLPNSNVEKFGGEGTGLHYDDKRIIGWTMNTWVRVVSRRWDYNGHSFFGYWSYDYGTTNWTHHVTMDFPVPNVKFNNGSTNSFLEDWNGTPQNYRKGLYKNGYKRAAGVWMPYNTATYSGNGSSVNDNKANAGVEDGAYFMEYGGSAVKTVKEGQKLSITLPAAPVLTIGQLVSTTVSYKADVVSVSWVVDQKKSPQFSYTVNIIDKNGTTVMTEKDTVPHLRAIMMNTKNLAAGTYTVRVSIVDIFDQVSPSIDKAVVINTATGISDATVETNRFAIYPNPCSNALVLTDAKGLQEKLFISIYNLIGSRVAQLEPAIGKTSVSINVENLDNGVYFLEIRDSQNQVQRIKFVKE